MIPFQPDCSGIKTYHIWFSILLHMERLVDLVDRKLGVNYTTKLSERIEEYLAKGQFEMAVIEYRKETGAGLEVAFSAVRNKGQLDLESKLTVLIAELDRRFPDAVPR